MSSGPRNIVVAASLALPATAAFAGGIGGLGDLAGGGFGSAAFAVSNDGRTVVGAGTDAGGTAPIRWTLAGGLMPLDGDGTAFGLTGDGTTAVGESGGRATLWAGGEVLDLGDLSGGTGASAAAAVAAGGDVAVGVADSTQGRQAFRWTGDGGMIGLGDLPGGTFQSTANGLTPDGNVVVGGGASAVGLEAFRWTDDTGLVSLGDLPGGPTRSAAFDVTDDGGTVVGAGRTGAGSEAFLWTAAAGMVGLGDLPGGFYGSVAYGVSGDGGVVVGQGSGAGGSAAFVWTPDAGLRSLADVLAGLGVDLGDWQALREARGVSSSGRYVVGRGTNAAGFDEAFLADLRPDVVPATFRPPPTQIGLDALGGPGLGASAQVPEPAAAGTIALAGIALLRRWR